jgi:hypothetical protein
MQKISFYLIFSSLSSLVHNLKLKITLTCNSKDAQHEAIINNKMNGQWIAGRVQYLAPNNLGK